MRIVSGDALGNIIVWDVLSGQPIVSAPIHIISRGTGYDQDDLLFCQAEIANTAKPVKGAKGIVGLAWLPQEVCMYVCLYLFIFFPRPRMPMPGRSFLLSCSRQV